MLHCLIVIIFVSPPEKVTVPVCKEIPLKHLLVEKQTNKQSSSSVFILITSVNDGHSFSQTFTSTIRVIVAVLQLMHSAKENDF